jgi:hypothetical protein
MSGYSLNIIDSLNWLVVREGGGTKNLDIYRCTTTL